MAAVFDGDPKPPYDIILDPNVDEFIRAGMVRPRHLSEIEPKLCNATAAASNTGFEAS
jgi:hypothetical protein